MNSIDIHTTQNVSISYALATLRDRIFAFLIDAVIYGFAIVAAIILFSTLEVNMDYASLLFLLPVFLFYSLISELVMNGQSFGKKVLGLRVVKINGRDAAPSDYFVRWIFRFIDIWFSLGSIAVILISTTERRQRLGDLLAQTAIIKLHPWNHIQLDELLKIHEQGPAPKFLAASQFSEEEMLLVKETLDRAHAYRNSSHLEAVKQLSQKISKELNVEVAEGDAEKFLHTVLTDYITLRR
jgi:uncharacterized RDD family membrane protein YckC